MVKLKLKRVSFEEGPEGPSPNMMVPLRSPGTSGYNEFSRYTYLLRVTHGEITQSNLSEFISIYSNKFIVSKETSKKGVIHFHATIKNPVIEMEKFREKLKSKWNVNSGHLHNLQIAETEQKGIIYVLKGKSSLEDSALTIVGEWDMDLLKQFLKRSYMKYSKEDFAKDLDELVAWFYERETRTIPPTYKHSPVDFMQKFVELKLKYNQTIIWRNICIFTETQYLKRDPDLIHNIARSAWLKHNEYQSENYRYQH